jgi:hypothetical protein
VDDKIAGANLADVVGRSFSGAAGWGCTGVSGAAGRRMGGTGASGEQVSVKASGEKAVRDIMIKVVPTRKRRPLKVEHASTTGVGAEEFLVRRLTQPQQNATYLETPFSQYFAEDTASAHTGILHTRSKILHAY